MTRVYLSATRLDLADECATVADWLSQNGYEPVDSYSPDSTPVLESCLADVDSCQLFILIQGHRYGHRPGANNPDNLSITHLEYRHAGRCSIPRIALQSTSIPNVELTDIRDHTELASVNAFRDEVSGTTGVRPGRFADLSELIAQLRDGVTNEARRLGLLPQSVALIEAFRNASHDLLDWPDTLSDGTRLEQPELEALRERILNGGESITLLLGEPGCGKSALLARLGREIQETGIPVLGIKANMLPADTHTRVALQSYLELPVPVTTAVHTLAQNGPVLVLLDQLDALADLVVQHSARLRILLNLVRDLAELPNIHLVASCRSFEQRHDPSLRNLESETLVLELPSWDLVQVVLDAHGIRIGNWSEEMRGTLRIPAALNTFLSLLQNTDEPGLLNGFQGMLQVQWERRVLCDTSGERMELLLELARDMAEREVLWRPLDRYANRLDTISALTAEGMLRWEEGSGRVEFRHQTLFEFVRARAFLDREGSLTATVLERQGSLRIRPQLWHALAYLRRVAPDQYEHELQRLLEAGLRPHLRMLLIEFLGMQAEPSGTEARLAFERLDNPWFRARFLAAVRGSPGWFARLSRAYIPQWMSGTEQETQSVLPLLEPALAFDQQTVLNLIDAHWLNDPARDLLSWRVLAMGQAEPNDIAWVDRLQGILERCELAAWTVNHVTSVVAATLPEEAPRLILTWLERQWREARSQRADEATENTEDESADEPPLDQIAKTLLDGRDLHDLTAVAEAAPRSFVQSIWPFYLELHTFLSDPPHPFVVGYRDNRAMIDSLNPERDEAFEHPLHTAVTRAIEAWAEGDPAEYLSFVDTHSDSDLLPVHRLLTRGLVHCVSSHPTEVLAYLTGDPRRLVLGPFTDDHHESRVLIQALAPYLDADQRRSLEQTLVNWHRYTNAPDDGADTRFRRQRWDREHRLRLLRALPDQYRSPEINRLVVEEERALPDVEEHDIRFSGMHVVGSPMSAEQMANAHEEDLIHLFEELTDDHEWHHPRDHSRGGPIQAGRELAQLAQTDPERAIRIARRLRPGINEMPVGMVLEALPKGGLSGQAIFDLVEEFAAFGFSSPDFHRYAARAVDAAISPECPVPDSLLDLLESWLVSETEPEGPTSESARDESRTSLLWGWGRMTTLPHGNFPLLAALSNACLSPDPPRMDRWLSLLEAHIEREESPRI